jgi:cellobiose-specific phosphotransferase system component IIB
MLLSPKYQAYMAKTGASPSMMAKALSKLPQNTDPEAALQAITSGRIAMQPSRLSDLLGE